MGSQPTAVGHGRAIRRLPVKTLATVVIGIGALALVACGGSDSKSSAANTPPSITPSASASVSVTTGSSPAATSPEASPSPSRTVAATVESTATTTTAETPTPGNSPISQPATSVPATAVPPTAVPPTAVPPTQPAGAPASATVNANAQTFSPIGVTIRAGGTVTWVWAVKQFHNIVVDGFAPSETTNTGPFSQAFAGAGSYSYHCEVHPDTMRGTVTVQ